MKRFHLPLLIAMASCGTLTAADSLNADYIKSTSIKVSEWQRQDLPPRYQPLGADSGVFHTRLARSQRRENL